MVEYARSTVVYREIRGALDPWCKANGYRRLPGAEPCWVRKLDEGGELGIAFHVNPWGGGTIGGNSFYGVLEARPELRQCDVALCLAAEELDALREIQNTINERRPRTEELEQWMREDSAVGQHTRDRYRRFAAHERPYRVGDFATFGYYGVDDVRLHAAFLAQHLPQVLARFAGRRCATPNPVPQPRFLSG